MRAIVYSSAGPSSVLRAVHRDPADPGAGEVRVRIAVSGVNPTDWKARATTPPSRGDVVVPNQDGAGIVDAVGSGVNTVRPGDRVWVYYAQTGGPTGTAQEYTVIPAERAVRLPDGIDFTVGASLGVPAITAHRALTVHENGPTRLSPGALDGRFVLVQGGAGAVGHAAIQLAVWAGATVAATVSSERKAALARAAGAHHTIDYTSEDVAERLAELAPQGVDQIVEVSIARNAELDARIAANHAAVAYYADDGGDAFSMPVRPSFAKNIRVQGVLLYTIQPSAFADAIGAITDALRDGALPVGEESGLPLTWFDLDDTAAAHDAVEGAVVGKVLIRVADL